jgi:hypothetical protein
MEVFSIVMATTAQGRFVAGVAADGGAGGVLLTAVEADGNGVVSLMQQQPQIDVLLHECRASTTTLCYY